MFWEAPAYYKFIKVSVEETGLSNPIKIHRYRFKAKKRSYLVSVEEFDFKVYAIKYCGLKDRKAKAAYSLIYNDGDAIKVISTCLQIMLHMWKEKPTISFGFYATPRIKKGKSEKVRFNVYEEAMLNLFSPKDFKHYEDQNSCIYILLNKVVRQKKATIKKIGLYLLAEHDMIFDPIEISKKSKKKNQIRIG